MYPPRSMLLVSLLFALLGVCYGKKCHFSKELVLTQNMIVSLNSTNNVLTNTMQDNIRLRSLSPWSYKANEDENRYPRVIHEALCNHDWCLDFEGNKDLSRNSVPITHSMLVLRREIANCHQNFRLEFQQVTVGCTCSRPNIKVAS
ncbi:interleukin-17A-like [Eleutherodactylus coqui]|uniref:interleukin-17A-like n=1 Tax=Eleutherodactylus coqui TaxID=57060 RepID=UPI003462E45D